MSYTIILLFTICRVMYAKWQFQDIRGNKSASRKWHLWGWFMQAIVIGGVLYASFQPFHWKDVALAAALSLPVFDIGVNLLALGQPVFYVGNTATWDRLTGHFKWIVYLMLIILAITVNVVPWNAGS